MIKQCVSVICDSVEKYFTLFSHPFKLKAERDLHPGKLNFYFTSECNQIIPVYKVISYIYLLN